MARDNQDLQNLAKIANSPDGQRLLHLARQSGGDQLETAMRQAEGGNYEEVKAILSKMLESDEAKALIQRMRHE